MTTICKALYQVFWGPKETQKVILVLRFLLRKIILSTSKSLL